MTATVFWVNIGYLLKSHPPAEAIQAGIDGELSLIGRRRLIRHAAGCHVCRAEMAARQCFSDPAGDPVPAARSVLGVRESLFSALDDYKTETSRKFRSELRTLLGGEAVANKLSSGKRINPKVQEELSNFLGSHAASRFARRWQG